MSGLVFGPVPSRRFGRSLGVNNVPGKTCSYSCLYCQVGRTDRYRCRRGRFHEARKVVSAVKRKIKEIAGLGERFDCVTFVSEGEPTLDSGLGAEIRGVAALGCEVAVITNGSLLWKKDVRQELADAQQVCVKVDAVREDVWRALDRPHKDLRLSVVLEGVKEFARSYRGRLLTETMLIEGVNDDPEGVRETAGFIAGLLPVRAYLSVPTRPPADFRARIPGKTVVEACRAAFSRGFPRVSLLCAEPGGGFGLGGELTEHVLSITAVHPMREDALRALVGKSGADWTLIEGLVAQGGLVVREQAGRRFYRKGPSA
ncbi:MAG: radical SAM protein [Elusimicrobiota bacterium]